MSVGRGYNSANRETLASRSCCPLGPAGRLLLASPFCLVKGLWGPIRVTRSGSPFPGPSLSPASPHPYGPRRVSFCVWGYQGPRGVSLASGRQPAMGPPCLPVRSRHPTLSPREPDRAGSGNDWNQSPASGDCRRVGSVIDPGLDGLAYGHLGPPPILQLTSDRGVTAPLTSPS